MAGECVSHQRPCGLPRTLQNSSTSLRSERSPSIHAHPSRWKHHIGHATRHRHTLDAHNLPTPAGAPRVPSALGRRPWSRTFGFCTWHTKMSHHTVGRSTSQFTQLRGSSPPGTSSTSLSRSDSHTAHTRHASSTPLACDTTGYSYASPHILYLPTL